MLGHRREQSLPCRVGERARAGPPQVMCLHTLLLSPRPVSSSLARSLLVPSCFQSHANICRYPFLFVATRSAALRQSPGAQPWLFAISFLLTMTHSACPATTHASKTPWWHSCMPGVRLDATARPPTPPLGPHQTSRSWRKAGGRSASERNVCAAPRPPSSPTHVASDGPPQHFTAYILVRDAQVIDTTRLDAIT